MEVNSVNVKLVISAAILVIVVAAVPAMGFTTVSEDSKQGMVIDFGYWDTVWVEMMFEEGTDGHDALEAACHIKGYDLVFLDDGSLYSVNGQSNLVGISWSMYVQSDGRWVSADPEGLDAHAEKLICWARSSGPDTVVPGTDAAGHSFYSYAGNGISYDTGEELRIITLAPSVTETVSYVGGSKYIIGTDLYSDYPAEITEGHDDGSISITGGYTDPNYEWIIKLDPDIVFCDGGTGEHVTIADKLRKSGVNCVVLYDCTDMNMLFNNTWISAAALGLSENANKAIQALRHTVDAVAGIAGVTGKRVFVSLSADPSPWTAGSQTFMSDIISVSGGKNVFESQSSSWFMVSKEQIYVKQPEIIIVISGNQVSSEEAYQAILDTLDPVWKETPAFGKGNVYIFSGDAGDILQRPGPRLAEAVEILCKILNSEPFEQRDPMDVVPKYFDDSYWDYLSYQTELIL